MKTWQGLPTSPGVIMQGHWMAVAKLVKIKANQPYFRRTRTFLNGHFIGSTVGG